jgi:cell division protein ZapA
MPQVEIVIGGRTFEVACQEGEESYLQSASAMLDVEASHLSEQIGRMPEARMLLMAGLMLADRTAGLEDKVKQLEAETAQMRAQIDTMQAEPVRVEVPVVPAAVTDALAEIAARAEALAEQVEAR